MSDKSRERFEEYMRCEVWPNRSEAYDMLNRDLSTGVYEYQVATDHWETWHVAWQARDAEVEELVKALERISNLRYEVEGDCGAVKIAEDAIAKHEGGG